MAGGAATTVTASGVRPRHFGAAPKGVLSAFRDVQDLPALAYSRDAALDLIEREHFSAAEVTAAIESDPGLTAAVVGTANRLRPRRGGIRTVRVAVESLGQDELGSAIRGVRTFGLLERGDALVMFAERYRLHAVKARRAADHICTVLDCTDRDEQHVAALLHDIGRTWLLTAHERYVDVLRLPATPEQRLALERDQFGMDHAMAGGVLVRRLGFPESLARVIETHHSEDADHNAARIRLADMLAHYLQNEPVDRTALHAAAQRVGIEPPSLTVLVHGLAHAGDLKRHRDPNPLSPRQRQLLRLLAQGWTYSRIAAEVGLSVSTVRTHLHEAYGKLRVIDRAQAVLTATDRGWL